MQPAGPAAPKATALRLLDTLPLLASLTEAEKQALAETMTRKTYQKGEVLVEEGGKLSSLVVIRTGVVVVSCHSEEGEAFVFLDDASGVVRRPVVFPGEPGRERKRRFR